MTTIFFLDKGSGESDVLEIMPRMPTAPTEKILGTMLVEMRDTFRN